MLGGLHGIPWRQRVFSFILLPVALVLVLGLLSLPATAPAAARQASHPHHKHTVLLNSHARQALTPEYLQSLPHGESATTGRARFARQPPAIVATSAGVPSIAMAAYSHAAKVLTQSDPGCHLTWFDLAAIGTVESDNGLTWGSKARVTANGTVSPPILGPPLDGSRGRAADRAPSRPGHRGEKWVRALGPMQFLPGTWAEYAQDVSGTGPVSPQNFWDATLTAGVYLCANGSNLATTAGFDAAVLAYNRSRHYLSLVAAWAAYYRKVGPAAVLARGKALLPTTIPAPKSADHERSSEPSRPAYAVLERAVGITDSKGSYVLDFRLTQAGRAGRRLASGTARVDIRERAASIALNLPPFGDIALVETRVGPRQLVDVRLPHALAVLARVPQGRWLPYSGHLAHSLPDAAAAPLDLAENDLWWQVDELQGATAPARAAGEITVGGVRYSGYSGTVELSRAAARVRQAGPEMARLANLLGTDDLSVTAWVSPGGLVERVVSTLPRLLGFASGSLSLAVTLAQFGTQLRIIAPASTASAPPTTSTTTTTTTTTVPPTTSTTTTSTTTTVPPTTTTTTVPPTTSTTSTTTSP